MPKMVQSFEGSAVTTDTPSDVHAKLSEGLRYSLSFIKMCAEEILQMIEDGQELSGRPIADGSILTLGDCVEILSRHYANFRQCSVSLSSFALSAKSSVK